MTRRLTNTTALTAPIAGLRCVVSIIDLLLASLAILLISNLQRALN